MKCQWCLATDHTTAACTKLAAFTAPRAPTDARSDADDAFDALQTRFLRQRTFSFGLLDVIKKGGLSVPAEILALSPDPIE